MVVLQWVEQKGKEKRNAGDKMGWATAHFRHWVATQERCRNRLGLVHASWRAGQEHCRTCGRNSTAVRLAVRAT